MHSSDNQALSPVPKGFWPLMFTQFQGAFSDNALKWLVIFLLFAQGRPEEEVESYTSHTGVLFAVPFLLFSVVSGWLSDRISKRTVMRGVKFAEIGIMLLATWSFYLGSLPLQLTAICLMGLHSTFFAPAKYGILPEVLPADRLSWGNGILEMLTFVAIILGTVTGGWLAEHFGPQGGVYSGLLLMALAILGSITSLRIPAVEAGCRSKKFNPNIPAELWIQTAALRSQRDLFRANWGNAAFFFISALLQINLTLFAKFRFGYGASQQSYLQAALCLGIGAGSVLAGTLSRGKIRYGFVPLGGLLMAFGGCVMGIPELGKTLFTMALAVLGIGGGLFIVPVAAVLQHLPSTENKGAVQGISSWWSWVAIAVASLAQPWLSDKAGWSYENIFSFVGVIALITGLYVGVSRLGWFKKTATV